MIHAFFHFSYNDFKVTYWAVVVEMKCGYKNMKYVFLSECGIQ